MEIVKFHMVGSESRKAGFAFRLECVGAGLVDALPILCPVNPPLGRVDNFLAIGPEHLTDQAFAFTVGSIAVRRIEKVDAGLEGRGQRCPAVLVVDVHAGHPGNGPAA